MTSQQATLGKVTILDGNCERAAKFRRCLSFLNYEPVVIADVAPGASIADDNIAIVVGDLTDAADLAETANDYRATHADVPFFCFPDSRNEALQLGKGPIGDSPTDNAANCDGPTWMLDMPLRRCQLTRLLQRAQRYRGQDRRQRLTGTSQSIRAVRRQIEQVAEYDTNVLVTGQSGTGKELVARTIHDLSDRADKPFVPINCGAIPADLLESELFGHEKGAFTGAITARTGRFELAEGGTLFLDEIGDMSFDMQVKLLRVLQERTFERVGSNKSQACDVRIVAATHRDLPAAVKSGEFREDLFYRLNVFPIEMPPLYKRVSDLPQLLDELLLAHTGNRKGELRISPDALQVLANYSWPGNIRELSNLVERLAIVKPIGQIEVGDLPPKYRQPSQAALAEVNNVSHAMQITHANLKEHLQNVEQELISQAIEVSDGVVAKAARLLGMRRTTLVEKIGKYKLS